MPHKRANNYHDVTEKLIDVSEATLDKFQDTVDSIQGQAKRYSKQMERYVLDNPNQSLGIAFVAGFVTALFLRGWLK